MSQSNAARKAPTNVNAKGAGPDLHLIPNVNREISTHGILKQQPASDEIGVILEEVACLGYSTFQSGLSKAEIAELNLALETSYEKQKAELKAEASIDLDATNDADVVRCSIAYDPAFLKLATNPTLMAVCKRLFGESFILIQQNGLINRPSNKHYQAKWHRDLAYQHWTSSEPMAIACLIALDEFTVETGGTHVLPATHHLRDFPTDDYVRRHEMPCLIQPGTFLIMDAMLYHRAGRNTSAGLRRAVNHVIGRPFMGQVIDLPKLLGPEHAKDPFLSRYLGYRWAPAPDVTTWRRMR
jgi:ectoine hydroxylase-related dioxygenase (phytanoyl-CoA dioxygenase family)